MTKTETPQISLASHFFLTSKPYSYGSEISRCLAFYLLLAPNAQSEEFLVPALLSLLMWIYFNWQSDRIQSDPGRIQPPVIMVFIPLAISIGLSFWFAGMTGAIGVLVYAFTICLYALKALKSWAGPLGPVFRIITVFGSFCMIWAFTEKGVPPDLYPIIIVLCFWKGIRNLIGDVRDIRTDTHEIPARFGGEVALWVIRAGLLLVTLIALKAYMPIPFITILLSWSVLEIFHIKFPADDTYKWGYTTHRFFIISTVILDIGYAAQFGLPTLWTIGLIIITISLQFSYSRLPGKTFPNWAELF